MSKVISYRQKLIELARIYKIDRVFDQNFKHSTYDIEIMLLKNKVPIPSRRGYVSHKFINEILKPFYENFKKVPKIHARKYLKNFSERLREKLNVKINFNISKYLKKFLNSIKDYFEFTVSNIVNFFKTLFKIIVESLNDIYNFKINEKIIKNIFLKTAYASVLVILVFSGFFIKDFITDVDALKTSLEIQSDKKVKDKESRKKVVKKQLPIGQMKDDEIVRLN